MKIFQIIDKIDERVRSFYVRNGNSQQVDITEVASYINQRFN